MTGPRPAKAAMAAVLAGALGAQSPESASESRPSRSAPPFGVASRPAMVGVSAALAEALAAGDDEAAESALQSALSAREGRASALGETLAVAEAAGRVELWLAAAARASDADPEDPAAAYFAGFVLQRQKLLRAAEPFLRRAVERDPTAGPIVSAYAWNAFLRFDSEEALRRSSAAPFDGRDQLLGAVAAARAPGVESAPRRRFHGALAVVAVAAASVLLLVTARRRP